MNHMPEGGYDASYHKHLEVTHEHRSWLDKANRMLGHFTLTGIGQVPELIGSATFPLGIWAATALHNPILAAIGAIPTAVGIAHDWMTGRKFAPTHEKVVGVGLKAAQAMYGAVPDLAMPVYALNTASTLLAKRFRP